MMKKLRYAGSKFADFCNSNFVINYTNNWGWIISGLISEFNKIGKEKLLVKRFIYEDGLEYGYLPITPSELDCAYSIENYCEYRGEVLECSFNGEKNEFGFDMRWVSKEICEKFGLAYEYERKVISRGIEDTGLVMSVPDSEIQNVWEMHKPIEGFPFKGPEKVWVKKDGIWLR